MTRIGNLAALFFPGYSAANQTTESPLSERIIAALESASESDVTWADFDQAKATKVLAELISQERRQAVADFAEKLKDAIGSVPSDDELQKHEGRLRGVYAERADTLERIDLLAHLGGYWVMSTNDQSELAKILWEFRGHQHIYSVEPYVERLEALFAARDTAHKSELLAAVGEDEPVPEAWNYSILGYDVDDELAHESNRSGIWGRNAVRKQLRQAIEHLYGAKSWAGM
jgi:hypothetical protein